MKYLGMTRTIDLDEVIGILEPYAQYQPKITLTSPDNRISVEMTLRAPGDTHAKVRTAAVEVANLAMADIEAAGYEHASVPQVRIGGIEVPDLGREACQYVVDAELTMELLGKRP